MKVTDLVRGDFVQVLGHNGWVITRFQSIHEPHDQHGYRGFEMKRFTERMPEEAWFGDNNGDFKHLGLPLVHLPTKGISSRLRPVSSETITELCLIRDRYEEKKDELAAIKDEWEALCK